MHDYKQSKPALSHAKTIGVVPGSAFGAGGFVAGGRSMTLSYRTASGSAISFSIDTKSLYWAQVQAYKTAKSIGIGSKVLWFTERIKID